MRKSTFFKLNKFLKSIFCYFLFILAFTSCSTNADQLAPEFIKNHKVDFFLEKGVDIDEYKRRIFFQYIFYDDNTYSMKSNTPFQKEIEPEKNGTYEYSVKSIDKALLWLHYIDFSGEKITYEMYLTFEDSKSGMWSIQGSEVLHEAKSGMFLIERQEN